ncbi:hypothetical protein E2562_000376 [Oryza meyeriana var. granulata]|uniref:Uncharacterized protein n=1 Tax=Oryza meyeriana var. granulata TaxID=110450 RepID=A0A6G1CB16_9ORYZ|nr:hypothetical protein E2562_000376 [Oryza meyeriana var. granulata]
MVLVTGAMGSLLLKLGELLKDEYDLQKGVRKKIECLTRELESVHGVLRMVGEVPPEQLNEPVKLWARDLREASYDMEDIIDGYLVRIDGPEPTDHTHMLRHLRKNVAKLFKKTKARRKIAGAIRDINERLQEVAARRGRYTVNDNIPKLAVTTTVDPRLQAMYKNASELVGMEGQMNELVKMLSLGVDIDLSDKTMKMVSIFGLGGLGKTTLARAVYDKFELDFDCRAFVPILKVRDMEVLGRLPELYYLQLDVAEYTETVTTDKTDGNGYFRKLRFCHTPFLFLWFDLHDGIMCKNKSIMPNLESLKFLVNVRVLKDSNPHVGFGKLLSLGHLGTTSLQRVKADICCLGALATEVEEAEVALAHAAAVHPNHPTINTTRTKQGGMIYHYHCQDFSCSQLGARRIIPKAVVKNVHARLMMDEYGYCDFHWLLQNPHAEKFSVTIGCEDAALEEVEETEAAARCAVHDHPNHPTLEIVRRDEDKMVTFDRGQEPDVVHRHARAWPTLDPEFDPPRFRFLDGDSQRFKWLRKIEFVEKFILSINCENASLEEVEKTEAAAKYTVDRHPNRPILELMRYNEDKMVLSDQHQQVFTVII